jgi:hypothetical protein
VIDGDCVRTFDSSDKDDDDDKYDDDDTSHQILTALMMLRIIELRYDGSHVDYTLHCS